MLTLFDRQEAVRTLESRLIKALTLARLKGSAVATQDGRFKVTAMLGRGASGVVCAATDTKMTRPVALKLYPGLPDDDLAAGVRAEARALARLNHPNVVTVHDFDASELRPGGIWCFYVSMELLRGPSLRRWLAQGPPVARVLEMFCQAGDGLAKAHAAGLVHRDFKPENVMLDGDTPKIVDFGLAREMVTTGLSPVDSHQRAIVGTLAYMAPEALAGRADARSDVFSFAAAVWEACYGEFPYAIDTLDPATRRKIASPRRRASLPEGLHGCLSKALRGEPRDRTGTIAEVVSELRSLVPMVEAMATAGASVSAGAGAGVSMTGDAEPLAVASSSRPARRNSRGAGLVLTFGLVGGAGAIGGLWATGFWATGAVTAVEEEDGADTETEIVVAAPAVAAGSVVQATVSPDARPGASEEPASAKAPNTDAPPANKPKPTERCASERAFVGAWSIETEAKKDTRPGGIGLRGRYEFDVHLDDERCRLTVDVAKIGMGNIDMRDEPRRATTKGRINESNGGTTLVLRDLALKRAKEARAPFVYRMEIARAGAGLRGTFEGESSDGRRLSGPLTGKRR